MSLSVQFLFNIQKQPHIQPPLCKGRCRTNVRRRDCETKIADNRKGCPYGMIYFSNPCEAPASFHYSLFTFLFSLPVRACLPVLPCEIIFVDIAIPPNYFSVRTGFAHYSFFIDIASESILRGHRLLHTLPCSEQGDTLSLTVYNI